jgi:short-subunit dehydrogenase
MIAAAFRRQAGFLGDARRVPLEVENMRKAIVIGSSTGIGRALSKVLAENGYEVGLTGRKLEAMEELQGQLPTRAYVKQMDLTRPEEARQSLTELIDEMGDVELIVINSGVGSSKPSWEEELEIISVNVVGFAAMARTAMEYFVERDSGHIVGISSISALRGITTAYSSSKAFDSTYLEALQFQADRLGVDVRVTDVKPGFVDTPMTEGRLDTFWVAPVEKAALQIFGAIRKRKRHVYVTKRWRLMAWVMKALPHSLASSIQGRRRR